MKRSSTSARTVVPLTTQLAALSAVVEDAGTRIHCEQIEVDTKRGQSTVPGWVAVSRASYLYCEVEIYDRIITA